MCFIVERAVLRGSVVGVVVFALGADVQFAAAWHTDTFHSICDFELRGAV
jgi:hypothetical protein